MPTSLRGDSSAVRAVQSRCSEDLRRSKTLWRRAPLGQRWQICTRRLVFSKQRKGSLIARPVGRNPRSVRGAAADPTRRGEAGQVFERCSEHVDLKIVHRSIAEETNRWMCGSMVGWTSGYEAAAEAALEAALEAAWEADWLASCAGARERKRESAPRSAPLSRFSAERQSIVMPRRLAGRSAASSSVSAKPSRAIAAAECSRIGMRRDRLVAHLLPASSSNRQLATSVLAMRPLSTVSCASLSATSWASSSSQR
eukprot:6194058-Pleurochrysis_carterae.AAC.2